jgi:hypothetical protein
MMQTHIAATADRRTDDLGFAYFEHEVDPVPPQAGDITYRRRIFYPIMYWSDVAVAGGGLTLVTHGLQGLSGAEHLSLLLARQVDDEGREGVRDSQTHTLRYAYLPRPGDNVLAWQAAYAFNQPLIVAWRAGPEWCVQLPFGQATQSAPSAGEVFCQPQAELAAAGPFAMPASLLAADGGLVADVWRQDGQTQALVLGFDPAQTVTVTAGEKQVQVAGPFPQVISIDVP